MDLPGLTVSARPYERDECCAVVSLAGRAGIADAAWIRQMLELPEAQGPGRIILDLSRLSSIDWWATLILLWAGRMVSRRGGTLVLASPQPAVARLLNAVGAAQALGVYQSVQQACDHRRRSRGYEGANASHQVTHDHDGEVRRLHVVARGKIRGDPRPGQVPRARRKRSRPGTPGPTRPAGCRIGRIYIALRLILVGRRPGKSPGLSGEAQ